MENTFSTETHAKDTEFETNEIPLKEEGVYSQTKSKFAENFFKYLNNFSSKLKEIKKVKKFADVIYLTVTEPPLEYISAFRKQYPNCEIKVLVPLTNTDGLEKPNYDFEYFSQNKINKACLYKLKSNKENIDIYGIFSENFIGFDSSRLQYLAPFTKAARTVLKKLKPEIIHVENIPFFLGAELEKNFSYPIKVLQIVNDFTEYEKNKKEAFWAAINLLDSKEMKRLCNDKIIKKCIASLFNLRNAKRFYQIKECLDYIYKNYFNFRKYIDKCDDIEENVLFNRLNSRAIQLFPQMISDDNTHYNMISYSIKKSDFWAVPSKTYYDTLITSNSNLSDKLNDLIVQTQDKSSYISYGHHIKDFPIINNFTANNFREIRFKNKRYLLKELSKDRIRTNFVDPKLFTDEKYIIKGFLDSFYIAPLIFCSFSENIYSEGIDVAITTILKLFEQYKNIQIIINIPNGLENNSIKSWINFMEQNRDVQGKWAFIDGKVNLAQFYASSDITFFPARYNTNSSNHYIAMKYGCIPVSTRVGIYNDTITDIFDDISFGCGLKTKEKKLSDENIFNSFIHTAEKTLNLYSNNPSSWNLLIKNCINYNSDWTFEIIEKFNTIYENLKK